MKQNEKNKYDDIIMLPHHVSKKRSFRHLLHLLVMMPLFRKHSG